MAELVFFSGTMDCGKSTLALQLAHNRAARGLAGMTYTRHDRAGANVLSSRLGLKADAVEVTDGLDLWDDVTARRMHGDRVDFLVCDEAQFYTPEQVEQLARVVDELGVDVFAFGITADFRTRLFPGSQRLVELADRVELLQVEALCWCGARATHNARTVGGHMVVEGEQVVVGDVNASQAEGGETFASGLDAEASDAGAVGYETLCRKHHMRRLSAADARAAALSPEVLPLGLDEVDLAAVERLETLRLFD
ncbi:thymidine kinase [Kineosporia sp. R_H_3]|uniref:thymidine kinase n=1 Tax=Kineosporia sp. R_H_3 TaxID=1961848 RepID=UPI000B4B9B57|nr:thymidine kinase [Kineosporia sp. R_H_3]